MRFRYIILLTCFVFVSARSTAQIHPVRISVQLTPPYSIYLPDYATEGRLRLIVTQTDFNEPIYRFILRTEIKHNGKTIIRSSRNRYPRPTTIAPGELVALTGSELAQYFETDNLDFVSYSRSLYERTKALPEGACELCFTACDAMRPDVAVSETTCRFFMLTKSEPPLLVAPACGTDIPANGAPIIFQWTPGNLLVAINPSNIEYALEIFEMRSPDRSPEATVQSDRPIFETTTRQTMFPYSPDLPPLEPGMKYAWRVRAYDIEGRDAFGNRGYGAACSFL